MQAWVQSRSFASIDCNNDDGGLSHWSAIAETLKYMNQRSVIAGARFFVSLLSSPWAQLDTKKCGARDFKMWGSWRKAILKRILISNSFKIRVLLLFCTLSFLLYPVCCAAYSTRDHQVIADVTVHLGVLVVAVLHDQFPVLRECPNQRSNVLLFISLKVSGWTRNSNKINIFLGMKRKK